jgi:S-adenosylmethionine synthetase
MASDYIFTSESVTSGHPDKLCDQISDALVGHYLRQDPMAQVVAECAVSTGILFVSVKAAADAVVDIANVARSAILDVGYTQGNFNGRTCTVMSSLTEAANGISRTPEETLSDEELDYLIAQENVTIFGYACRHTQALMPLPIWLAHALVRRLDRERRTTLTYLAPDAKCQVGIGFRHHQPERIDSVTLVASQLDPALALDTLRSDLREGVILPVLAEEKYLPDAHTRIQINPEGTLLEGGPAVHAGLTGRKTGVDTYGGYARTSGAALSGKDPTRIDRVGAYAARHAAKNLVHAGLASQCEVQLSYSIGLARPVSIRVETFGTGRFSDEELTRRIGQLYDFRLGGIIRRFGLRRLASACGGDFYRRLAVYGHVGRSDLPCPWEITDEAAALL